MEVLRALAQGFVPNAGSDVGGNGRDRRETLQQRLEIEPGATDQDRQLPGRCGLANDPARRLDPPPDREILARIDGAVEAVGDARHLIRIRTGRDDGQIRIDLHGIGIDHDAIETLGDLDSQRRLAAGGRTCDEDGLHSGCFRRTFVLTHVATLFSNPAKPAVTPDAVKAASATLHNAAETATLNAGIAVDIPFAPAGGSDNRAIADRLRAVLEGLPVDVVVQPAAGRRKRLFLADMDSTMIGQECIDELADLVGLKEHVSAITERAMRGEIAFEPALRERVALLKGLDEGVVEEVIASRITLTPGGRELVQTMRAQRRLCGLVSSLRLHAIHGPHWRHDRLHEDRSNKLVVEGGKLAGLVEEPILGREAKRETLIELRERFSFGAHETMAVGDGANDLAMLGEAGVGVAYHAKPKVAAEASVRIDHGDLSALLYMQGYAKAEFKA